MMVTAMLLQVIPPDGQSYIGEGKDEFGEYWIIGYFDGEPMRQYKENDPYLGGADLNFE